MSSEAPRAGGDWVIRADGLSKRYRPQGAVPGYRTLRDSIAGSFGRLRGGRGDAAGGHDEIWALRGITFEARKGDVVGLIGRNGAGKSTLLKLLARITHPTSGWAEIRGRIGSLLEVGTCFHPELSGRENVHFNGALLGMRRREILKRFDEIVSFAQAEKFIDMPVKHYSTGTYMRLAFAVAAHLDTEVLLVDEALAVGDLGFQKKCLAKIGEIGGQGRTVFFVSHSMHAVSSLTTRAMLLDQGRCLFMGATEEAVQLYRELFVDGLQTHFQAAPAASRDGALVSARVVTSGPGHFHKFGRPLEFQFEIGFKSKPGNGSFSFQLIDESGRAVANFLITDSQEQWSKEGVVALRCRLENPRLYMGVYTLKTCLADRRFNRTLEVLDGVCKFEVSMDEVPRENPWTAGECAYVEDGRWTVA